MATSLDSILLIANVSIDLINELNRKSREGHEFNYNDITKIVTQYELAESEVSKTGDSRVIFTDVLKILNRNK